MQAWCCTWPRATGTSTRMRRWNTSMPTAMTMDTIHTRTKSCQRVATAIGTCTNRRHTPTRTLPTRIISTSTNSREINHPLTAHIERTPDRCIVLCRSTPRPQDCKTVGKIMQALRSGRKRNQSGRQPIPPRVQTGLLLHTSVSVMVNVHIQAIVVGSIFPGPTWLDYKSVIYRFSADFK